MEKAEKKRRQEEAAVREALKEKQKQKDDDLALWQYRRAPDKHVLSEWVEAAGPKQKRNKKKKNKIIDQVYRKCKDQCCEDRAPVAAIQVAPDPEEHCCDRWDDVE